MYCPRAKPVRYDPSEHRLRHVLDIKVDVLRHGITDDQLMRRHRRDQRIVFGLDLEEVDEAFYHPFLACFIRRKCYPVL